MGVCVWGRGGGGVDVDIDDTMCGSRSQSVLHLIQWITPGVGVTGTRRPRGRSPKNAAKMRQTASEQEVLIPRASRRTLSSGKLFSSRLGGVDLDNSASEALAKRYEESR